MSSISASSVCPGAASVEARSV